MPNVKVVISTEAKTYLNTLREIVVIKYFKCNYLFSFFANLNTSIPSHSLNHSLLPNQKIPDLYNNLNL